jgi:DNA-binding transcriptional ArsR family regulator
MPPAQGPKGDTMTPQIGSPTPHAANAVIVDQIFRALSDPTRRNVLERLTSRPASVSELAAPYKMALPSFVEHLKVLETSGLVRSHKAGRVRTYELAADQLKLAEDWLGRQRNLWTRRLDRFDAYVMSLKEEESK